MYILSLNTNRRTQGDKTYDGAGEAAFSLFGIFPRLISRFAACFLAIVRPRRSRTNTLAVLLEPTIVQPSSLPIVYDVCFCRRQHIGGGVNCSGGTTRAHTHSSPLAVVCVALRRESQSLHTYLSFAAPVLYNNTHKHLQNLFLFNSTHSGFFSSDRKKTCAPPAETEHIANPYIALALEELGRRINANAAGL